MARPAPAGRGLTGSLHVQGGDARSRRLAAPPGIRPSQGLIVQAIFNVLGPQVLEAEVIDLFAGSGALGIEALSRGAARATFVDHDLRSVAVVRQNLALLGYQDRARVVRADVPRWLRSNLDELARARIVFLDPPYRDPVLGQTLRLLDEHAAVGTTVVTERGSRDALPELQRLGVTRDRRYGGTSVTIAVVA